MKTAVKICLICSLFAGLVGLHAASIFGMPSMDDPDRIIAEISNAQADEWEWVGKTMVFRGNIRIPYRDMIFYCDTAIVDTENKDIQLSGNVQVVRSVKSSHVIPLDEYQRLSGKANVSVELTGYVVDPLGTRNLKVDVWIPGERITADNAAGNLETGWFEFSNFVGDFGSFITTAAYGERSPDGIFELEDAEITTCEYQTDDKSHYSIGCTSATVKAHNIGYDGKRNYNRDSDEHSVLARNCTFKVFGVPVFWLPYFYKPKDQTLGLFQLVGGKDSDFGFYLSASRKFLLSQYPAVWVRPRIDWFEKRGIGYGATGGVSAENIKIDLYSYGIRDKEPYESSAVEAYRLKIPKSRYGVMLSGVGHITPRLDFRGQFNLFSDYYFLKDYYEDQFDGNPEPATFAALEYQFDRASLSVVARPRINDFYSTVQQLPKIALDMPRQELFGTGLYYQGAHTMEYLSMKWRDFDKKIYEDADGDGNDDREVRGPRDYETFRFDSVNFLYYPVKLFGAINILPRAGIRLTEYSDTSKRPVYTSDIGGMINASKVESLAIGEFNNYDDRGGQDLRVVGELGVEASMKFYRSWQNVRSPFLNLDGLRHVFEPYANYTYITEPTLDPEHIYYFDEIDRIDEANFVRIGMRNRLQTRRGNVANPEIYDWFTMDNYWDLFFKTEEGQSGAGDIGTMITFAPGNGFSLSTDISINVNGDYERQDIYRNGRNVGRPGLAGWENLNYWNISMSYALLEDLVFSLTYSLEDSYRSRAIYSMGSTLLNPNATSMWDSYSNNLSQTMTFSVAFPITRARDFRGSYSITYDFYQGSISEQTLRLIKTLHCWELAVELGHERDWNGHKYENEFSIRGTAYLTGLVSPLEKVQTRLRNSLGALNGGDGAIKF